MVKQKKKRKKQSSSVAKTIQFEIIGLLLLAFSVISLSNLGIVSKAGRFVAGFFMGDWSFLLLSGLIVLSIYFMYKREIPDFLTQRLFGIYLIIAAILLLAHIGSVTNQAIPYDDQHRSIVGQTWMHFWDNMIDPTKDLDMGGGMIGAILYATFHLLFDASGSRFIAFIVMIIGFILLTGLSLRDITEKSFKPIGRFFVKQTKAAVHDTKQYFQQHPDEVDEPEQPPAPAEEPATITISNFADHIEKSSTDYEKNENSREISNKPIEIVTNHFEIENTDYQLPPIHLLKNSIKSDQQHTMNTINANAKKLEQTLTSFGVKAKVTQIHLGPAVTQYEVSPNAGVKVSKIVTLADDIALALAAKDIRIEAPIPGKSAIGIEVPNPEISMVSLREVLEEQGATDKRGLLSFVLGRDISGQPIIAELNKMPHLLVAGSTGSGKSVCVNGIISNILMRAKPNEVKMMMIDPKMVELNVYNGIPHLLAPVVTDPKRAAQALKKIVSEMERRYELFSASGTRNIEGYNELIKGQAAHEKQSPLPYIVVLVDELADLMMVASSEVEDAIIRLAQMARAAGIHLIIATQRPSVDVITGIIKANIPSRIAFAVSSSVDSRTILDMGGAEKLLGRGDMLFFPIGAVKPVRIQGAFVSDQEVEDIVDFVSTQQKAQYQEEMIPEEIEMNTAPSTDEFYEDAVKLVVDMQTASVSLLQRRFRIGYSRAARLIDEMELHGVVGPYEGSKPRTVLISKELEKINE